MGQIHQSLRQLIHQSNQSNTNWEQKFETKDSIQNGEEFLEIITNNASENAPKRRQQGNNRKMPKERKRLHNRLKMLKREKHRAYSKERKKRFDKKILETEQKIIDHKRSERLEKM